MKKWEIQNFEIDILKLFLTDFFYLVCICKFLTVNIQFFAHFSGYILSLKGMGEKFSYLLFDQLSKSAPASTLFLETIKGVDKKVHIHFFENDDSEKKTPLSKIDKK